MNASKAKTGRIVPFIKAGSTLVWIEPPEAGPHLWIVLTDPEPKSDIVVVVRVETRKKHTENSVILAKGEHPYLTKEQSSVEFSTALPVRASRLEQVLGTHSGALQPSVPPGVLDRVRGGLIASPFTPRHVKDRCRALFAS